MYSIQGTFEHGVARPNEPIEGHEGESVMIVFSQTQTKPESQNNTSPAQSFDPENSEIEQAWDDFENLIEKWAIDTNISDFAHQHDHYLYGIKKRQSSSE